MDYLFTFIFEIEYSEKSLNSKNQFIKLHQIKSNRMV